MVNVFIWVSSIEINWLCRIPILTLFPPNCQVGFTKTLVMLLKLKWELRGCRLASPKEINSSEKMSLDLMPPVAGIVTMTDLLTDISAAFLVVEVGLVLCLLTAVSWLEKQQPIRALKVRMVMSSPCCRASKIASSADESLQLVN